MKQMWSNPFFGLALTFFAFECGNYLKKKWKSPLANPLLVTSLICYGVLKVLQIPVSSYMKGGAYIELFLVPATAVLGVSIYRQRNILKQEFLPILVGCLFGSLLSMGSTLLLCKFLLIKGEVLASLLPKSVTMAIALDLTKEFGGIPSITVVAVVLCGVGGAMLHPFLIQKLRLKNSVARGVAFGTASHAIGTVRAIEMGEVEGAVSGVAMGVSGILTVLIVLLVQMI